MHEPMPVILLVEDNPDHAELFVANLELTCYAEAELHTRATFAGALAFLRERHADIAFLDLSLPDSSISETLERLGELTSSCPVIVSTSLDERDIILDVIRRGADDCLPKSEINDVVQERAIRFAIDRWQLRQRLEESNQRLQHAFAGTGDGLWDWNLASGELFFSPQLRDSFAAGSDTPLLPLARWQAQVQPDDLPVVMAAIDACLHGDSLHYEVEYRLRDEQGEERWMLLRGQVVARDAGGAPLRTIATHTDISVQKEREEALRLASMVYSNSSEAMVVTDAAGNILAINEAFSELTGYDERDVLGRNPRLLKSGRQSPEFYQRMWEALVAEGVWRGEIWNRRKNGQIYPELLTINSIPDEHGGVSRYVALFSDITEIKDALDQISLQANYDQLTGLPNRRLFLDRLEQAILLAQREGQLLALLFIDLDRFKEVNDTLGHELGDRLLIQAASRIRACVRDSDTVARLGGDEFTVILPGLAGTQDSWRVAEKILDEMSQAFSLDGHEAFVSASIGIAFFPQDAGDVSNLLKNADQAMYKAKSEGRNNYAFFTRQLQDDMERHARLSAELRHAIFNDQLELHYQPIVELGSGAVVKAEALLRWNHPAQGLVSPALFIPLAEETGLIHDIGRWVFQQAMAQLQDWRQSLGLALQVSLNRSPLEFRSGCDWIGQLQALGLPGDSLVVEITEGVLVQNDEQVTEQLLAFRDAGIQVAIDDFGTGYSALAYLKRFDIDYLKIDQSFIRNLAPGSADFVLCEAIVGMAHRLGLKVIAEGVETVAQRDLLRSIGCDYGQGYLFARPLPAADFIRYLQIAAA